MANPNNSPFSRLRVIASVALLALVSGCVSKTEVRHIVNEANYQALVATTPGIEVGGIPADGKTERGAEDAAARINAFLSSHQGDTAMTGAPRLRQALLYLNQRSFALAKESISQVPDKSLTSPRDQAILAVFPQLLWWSKYALMTNQTEFYANHRNEAAEHMALLKTKADNLATLPDLQDYLREMRAWIGLKLACSRNDPEYQAKTIVDSVDTWTAGFSEVERSQHPGANPLDLATRRVVRLRAYLDKAAEQTRGIEATKSLQFSSPAATAYWEALKH